MDFLEGVRGRWQADELLVWCRRRLLLRGCVRLTDAVSGRLTLLEPGADKVIMPTSPSERLDERFAQPVRLIMETARTRVVETLSGMLGSPLDDRFVSAAIYAGRVRRTRGQSGWEPCLTEGEPLSQWVLALFAVDALSGREDYDRHLHVCEVCGAVSFALGGSRRRCSEHSDLGAPHSRVQRAVRPRTDGLRRSFLPFCENSALFAGAGGGRPRPCAGRPLRSLPCPWSSSLPLRAVGVRSTSAP